MAYLINGIMVVLFFTAGTLGSKLFGYLLGTPLPGAVIYGFAGITIWACIYVAWGIQQVEENCYLVIERFGKYYRTAHSGLRILCLPNIVDRVAPNGGEGDYKWREIELNNPKNKLDFKDASAPFVAVIWYRVKKTFDGPERFTYEVKDTEARIKSTIDGSLRFLLQQYTIDGACEKLTDISLRVRQDSEIQNALDGLGIELDPDKGVIITDIVLPQSLIDVREETLRGEREAAKQKEQGAGYARAIMAIKETMAKGAKDKDGNIVVKPKLISQEEARKIYETQRGLEVLAKKTGDIHFVSPDVNGMLLSLGVGDKHENEKGHQQ